MNRGKRLAGALTPMHIWKGAKGVRIAGETFGGPSNGPLVVLMHGGGETRHASKNTACSSWVKLFWTARKAYSVGA
jgi:non-heme chloroperoxidase